MGVRFAKLLPLTCVILLLVHVPSHAGDPERIEAVRSALSPRGEHPPCASIASGPGSAALFAEVAETVERPPWVPVRAASCAVAAAAAEPGFLPTLRAWVADAGRPALGLAVVGGLDAFEATEARALADAALIRATGDPRFARYALEPLRRSRHPDIAALARSFPEE